MVRLMHDSGWLHGGECNEGPDEPLASLAVQRRLRAGTAAAAAAANNGQGFAGSSLGSSPGSSSLL